MKQSQPDEMLLLPRLHWVAQQNFDWAAHQVPRRTRETWLHYVQNGALEVLVNNTTLRAERGQLLILPPAVPYRETFAAGLQIVAIFFAPCRFEFDASARVLTLAPDEIALRWLGDLTQLQTQHSLQREISGHLLAALLARLKQIEGRDAALQTLHPSVAAAVQWIDSHLAHDFTLHELAQRAHCSCSHLRALFKTQVGSGPLRYQQDQRLQLALQLLQQSPAPLIEIARQCGYNDVEYFARLFGRAHHISPHQLRKRQRENVPMHKVAV